jgi:hypothetical protein
MASTIAAGTTSGTAIAIAGDTSGVLQLQTNGTTAAVTIDTSQNVGIGTTSPTDRIHAASAVAAGLSLQATGTGGSTWRFLSTDNAASIGGGNLGFNNGSYRMVIDSSGNVLVGATATSNNAKFFVSASVADRFIRFNNTQPSAPFGVVIEYTAAAPNDTGKSFLFCADNSATRADIRSNGGLANYSANNVNLSDAREKTNVELAGSYLDKICSIPVKTFNYIDQNRDEDDGLTLGVIAQDVQAVAPELVSESDWGTTDEPKMRLAIYQTDLQYALMKAIQELNAKVEAQAVRIAELEGAK